MIKKIKKIFIILIINSCFINSLYAAEDSVLRIGSEKAKITVKVFSSLTCPHCASFHKNIFEKLKSQYIDDNKVIFEHHSFPLDLAALNAEKVLRSVSDVEKSFEFLTLIYKKQDQWAVGSDIKKINDYVKKIGVNFGLDSKRIDSFIADEKIQDEILNERIAAQKKYKISSTPTIYINEKKYEGSHEYKKFKKKLDKFL